MVNLNNSVICFGEVLWDLLPAGARIGGAPLNVCYHLNQHGISSQIISQIGDDKLGHDILNQLRSWNIDTAFCKINSSYDTSVVKVELDKQGKANYNIVENVAWDYIQYDETIAHAIAKSSVFIFGSLASRHTVTFNTLKQYVVHAKYAVMDINLRSPYYSADIILELLQYTDTLKINDEEIILLAQWLGIEFLNDNECLSRILDILPRLKSIILTKGANGAVYYSQSEKLKISSYSIDVNDTVGAGDSFLAAFIAAYKIRGCSIEDALEKAALVSAFVATQVGACPVYTSEDLAEFKLNHKKNN